MKARRGMMLLELMVALVVSATVVLLAYATLRGGLDTEARVLAAREQGAVHSVLRELLRDGIRHAVAGGGIRGDDSAAPELIVVTRGLNAVQGAGASWRMRLHVDDAGVILDADPLDGAHLPLRLRDASVQRFAVRYRGVGEAGWREHWDDSTRLPDAIELRWLDVAGRATGVPLVARPMAGER